MHLILLAAILTTGAPEQIAPGVFRGQTPDDVVFLLAPILTTRTQLGHVEWAASIWLLAGCDPARSRCYVNSSPRTDGDPRHVEVPIRASTVAVVHSHPANDDVMTNMSFSEADREAARRASSLVGRTIVSFLVTPTGSVRRYDPTPGDGARHALRRTGSSSAASAAST